MSNKDKVLTVINGATGPLCDDCLAIQAALKSRQIAYAETELLATAINRKEGSCIMCSKRKKVSWKSSPETNAINHSQPPPPVTTNSSSEMDFPVGTGATAAVPDERSWYWEGKIQSIIVGHLANRGFYIRGFADTAARTPGKDIIAVGPDSKEVWISVKGFPGSSANTQARHWFAGAVFDLILYRGENADVDLALGLPDGFATYANLAPRTNWLRKALPFKIFWVSESGEVREE